MDKKRSAFAAPDAGRMTDAELSKRLGGLQRRSAVWLLVGLAGAVSGTVCFFAVQAVLLRAILVTALFFGGVCCAVVFGGGARKKLKALMHEQRETLSVRNGRKPSARISTRRKCALTSRS